jgi:hypothetical protein
MLVNPGLDNRLTNGVKVVSPTHRPRSTTKKHYFFDFGTHFCYRPSKPEGLMWKDYVNWKHLFTSSGLEPETACSLVH